MNELTSINPIGPLFKVDTLKLFEEMCSPEGKAKIKQIRPRDQDKIPHIKKWIYTPSIKSNPIDFLWKWRAKKRRQLESYTARFYDNEINEFSEGRSSKENAYIIFAKTIMSADDYVPNFIDWLMERSKIILQQHYNESPECVISAIQESFANVISSPSFVKDLTMFRDACIKYVPISDLGCLKHVAEHTGKQEEYTISSNLIADCVAKSIYRVILEYFDFTHSHDSENMVKGILIFNGNS